MKKIIYYLGITLVSFLIFACGAKKEGKNAEEYVANESATTAPAASSSDAIAMGETLVKANDCKTCHHKENKLIGPSHTAVAKKYEFTKANVDMLAQKIIKGGSGNWGEIPMTPHPDISTGDAEKMAMYVLSLDGEKEH